MSTNGTRRNLPPQVSKIVTPSGLVRYEVRVDLSRGRAGRKQTMRRFKTKKEALDFLNPILGDQQRGIHVGPTNLTVKDAVTKWIASQRIKPTTKAAYTAALRPVVDELGDEAVQSITKDDIEGLVKALQDGTTERGVWANTSINPMLARTRAMFDDLQRQGILSRNVAALVKSVRRADDSPEPRGKALSPKEIQKLITYHTGKHDELLVRFALLGLRRGELAGLQWGDVDLTSKTVTISRNRTTDGKEVYEGTTKTQAGQRELPLPKPLIARLRVLQVGKTDEDYVLTQEKSRGIPFHPMTLSKRWSDAVEAAGVRHVRLHDARHTTATHLQSQGIPLADVAQWLGHANAEVTARVYSHSTKHGIRSAADALTWGGS